MREHERHSDNLTVKSTSIQKMGKNIHSKLLNISKWWWCLELARMSCKLDVWEIVDIEITDKNWKKEWIKWKISNICVQWTNAMIKVWIKFVNSDAWTCMQEVSRYIA